MADKVSLYKNKLQKDFPELQIDTLEIIGSGWHHDAVEVNDVLVFRMPRGVHEITSTVDNEVSMLNLLQDKLPVAIPKPLYISSDKEYFGYSKVDGVLLKDLVNGFGQGDWQQLKADWVAIASSIHTNVTIQKARKLKMPNFIEPGPSAAERIFGIEGVEQDVLTFANQIIESSKKLNLESLHYVFIHNDLQFHNILADPHTKRISGVIDWTDACVGPLAREFAIGEWMKPGLLEEVASLYEAKTGFKVDCDEARMWRSLEELGDFVESTEAGDLEDVQETLGRVRNMMMLVS